MIRKALADRRLGGNNEAKGRISSIEFPLQKSTAKMIVYCGKRTAQDPGHVAYTNRVSMFRSEYHAANSSGRETIVDSFLQIVDFQRPVDAMTKSWQPASEVWVRKKIKKALLEIRYVGTQNVKLQSAALVDRNDSDCKESFALKTYPPTWKSGVKQAPATVGLALHELDKKATATEKMIVYCGRRTSHATGNVAYMSCRRSNVNTVPPTALARKRLSTRFCKSLTFSGQGML
jgi:hypothetical protein